MPATNTLIAIHLGKLVGNITLSVDKLSFTYEPTWQRSSASFPISLSMPLTAQTYADKHIRPFLSGLLPDNTLVLSNWAKKFGVSPKNPFRLLAHVGEECAGAIQFVTPQRAQKLLSENPPTDIQWLSDHQFQDRLRELAKDQSSARRLGDAGQFSLAGAQPKTGLYQCPETGKWGIPSGTAPTTHILKPNMGEFDDYELNEHFCLSLANKVNLRAATSEIINLDDLQIISVKRYDRKHLQDHTVLRVHQEDTCQALSYPPDRKYQSDDGPDAAQIFHLLATASSKPTADQTRFLDALLFNWLIGGTDAHSKNYSLLLAGNGQVRLAPLYDITSCLAYPIKIPIQKAKLAMKIASEYKLHKITADHWRRAAKIWKIDQDLVMQRYDILTKSIPNAAAELHKASIKSTTLDTLTKNIQNRCAEQSL